MVTIPLAEICPELLDEHGCSPSLLAAVRRSISFHVRLMRVARREAEVRCAPYLPREMRTELEFKIEGRVLFVDIDIECPLAEQGADEDDLSGGAL